MIITKVHISSFGALKNVEFNFNNGINTIKEDNGYGKTTISVFIKAMFYGLNKNGNGVKKDERKKYAPWGSKSLFGGYIEFDYKGQNFRIERFFGTKESEDTIKLYDTKTMAEYKNTENLGERLFGIDVNGFVSTCFLSQNNYENSYESVISKFEDIAKTNSSNTFSDAVKILDDEIKELRQRGDKGEIPETQRKIYSLNANLEKKDSIEVYIDSLKKTIKENEEKINVLSEEISALEKKSQDSGKNEAIKIKHESFKKLNEDKKSLLEKKEKLSSLICGKILTDEEYQTNFERYNNYLLEKKENPQKNSSNFMIPFFVLSFISLVVSIIGIFILPVLFYICFPFTFVFVVLGLCFVKILKKKSKIVKNKSEKEEMVCLLNRYGYGESEIPNFLVILNKIRDVSKDYSLVLLDINRVNEELEKYSNDEDLKKEVSFDLDYDCLIKELNEKRVHVNLLKDETLKEKNNLVRYEEQLASFNDLESEKEELEENLVIYNEKYEVLSKTMEFLEKSNENMKVKYRKPLEEALNKYLQFIVKDRDVKAIIDTDLNIFIEENGSLKEADFYSKGFQDLFRICKSFALSSVLFSIEKPFIVLDDVFTNLDDKKLEEAIKSVRELSSEYQILYFVCHESRRA